MAQQSILGRITQLARANINALIDSAEDPQKMLDQMVRDYTGSISEAEEAVAQSIGNLRMMEADAQEAEEAAGDWGNKAAAAAAKADQLRAAGSTAEADRFDNLARVALKRQIDFEGQAKDLSASIAQQAAVVEKLKTGLNSMAGKLEELKNKRDELVARAKMAEAQNQVHDALKSIDVATRPARSPLRGEGPARGGQGRGAGRLAASSLDAQFEASTDWPRTPRSRRAWRRSRSRRAGPPETGGRTRAWRACLRRPAAPSLRRANDPLTRQLRDRQWTSSPGSRWPPPPASTPTSRCWRWPLPSAWAGSTWNAPYDVLGSWWVIAIIAVLLGRWRSWPTRYRRSTTSTT